MDNKRSIEEIIGERYANRTFKKTPINRDHQEMLEEFLAAAVQGPFGGVARFRLIAATEEDSASLRDLGTYGVIE